MITADLLDVNFLIALAWPNHISHSRAVAWFREHRSMPFATCPITEAGFVRLSMNPFVVREKKAAPAALAMLSTYKNRFPHVFWPDTLSVSEALTDFITLSGHRQVTDAYLLATAASRNGRLVTFDSGIAAIAPEGFRDNLLVVTM